MDSFEKTFDHMFKAVGNRSATAVAKSASSERLDSKQMSDDFSDLPSGPQEEFLLQAKIRPIFGKPGVNNLPIGTHPDFISLEGHLSSKPIALTSSRVLPSCLSALT